MGVWGLKDFAAEHDGKTVQSAVRLNAGNNRLIKLKHKHPSNGLGLELQAKQWGATYDLATKDVSLDLTRKTGWGLLKVSQRLPRHQAHHMQPDIPVHRHTEHTANLEAVQGMEGGKALGVQGGSKVEHSRLEPPHPTPPHPITTPPHPTPPHPTPPHPTPPHPTPPHPTPPHPTPPHPTPPHPTPPHPTPPHPTPPHPTPPHPTPPPPHPTPPHPTPPHPTPPHPTPPHPTPPHPTPPHPTPPHPTPPHPTPPHPTPPHPTPPHPTPPFYTQQLPSRIAGFSLELFLLPSPTFKLTATPVSGPNKYKLKTTWELSHDFQKGVASLAEEVVVDGRYKARLAMDTATRTKGVSLALTAALGRPWASSLGVTLSQSAGPVLRYEADVGAVGSKTKVRADLRVKTKDVKLEVLPYKFGRLGLNLSAVLRTDKLAAPKWVLGTNVNL
ncbi:hypothetical protein QJQ45_022214 [Haematococcus lacustris]|nr:hypothetical protein QJQ45_022214 [Haematococcus lacustris]